MRYITIKDEEQKIRPQAFLWKVDDNLKYHLVEIKKALKKDCKLVEVEILEITKKIDGVDIIEEFSLTDNVYI